MRDVIVIGAGGGGPGGRQGARRARARRADARGGRPQREARGGVAPPRERRQQPGRRLLPLRPVRPLRSPAWLRELPQNSFLWQVAGVGGTTLHYYGNSPRAVPGVFTRLQRRATRPPTTARTSSRSATASFVPYYEWVEHTLPVQTAAMGTKEEVFLEARPSDGPAAPARARTSRATRYRPQENAILQPQRQRRARPTIPTSSRYPEARGCTFCGFCFQGCYEPRGAPRNLDRQALDRQLLRADGADRRQVARRAARRSTLVADAFVTQHRHRRTARRARRHLARHEHRRGDSEEAQGRRDGRRLHREPAAVAQLRPAEPERLGRPRLHRPPLRLGHRRAAALHGLEQGRRARGARCDFPGRGGLENVGLPPALQAFSATFSDAGIARPLRQRRRARQGGRRRRSAGWSARTCASALSDIDRLLNVLVITDDDVEAQNRVTLSQTLPADENGPVAAGRVPPARALARARARTASTSPSKAVELLEGRGREGGPTGSTGRR